MKTGRPHPRNAVGRQPGEPREAGEGSELSGVSGRRDRFRSMSGGVRLQKDRDFILLGRITRKRMGEDLEKIHVAILRKRR